MAIRRRHFGGGFSFWIDCFWVRSEFQKGSNDPFVAAAGRRMERRAEVGGQIGEFGVRLDAIHTLPAESPAGEDHDSELAGTDAVLLIPDLIGGAATLQEGDQIFVAGEVRPGKAAPPA